MDDLRNMYQSNSIYDDTDQPKRSKMKPVVNAVSSRKPVVDRIKEALIGEDVVNNIIIPGIQNLILDGLERIFFHNNSRRSSGNYYYNNQPYESYYYGNPSYSYYQYNQPDQNVNRRQNKPDYRNIIVRTKQDADAVLNQLVMRIKECQYATVADLLDLVNCPSEYTDSDWGWMNTRGLGIRRVSQGFLIVVPDAQPIMR